MVSTTEALVDMPKVTVKLERSVTDKLKAASSNMNDTYDIVIMRLLEEHNQYVKLKDDYTKLKAEFVEVSTISFRRRDKLRELGCHDL